MRAIGPGDALEIVASQRHAVLDQTGLTVEQAEVAAWTVWKVGETTEAVGGARAIALAIAVGRDARWPTAPWRIPGFGWIADRAYLFVAHFRHRLPGETPWCVTHPGRCESNDR